MRKLFEPGNPGKPPGAKNKVTRDYGIMIDNIINDNEQVVRESFIKLSPFQKWKVVLELLQFRVPKQKAVEVTGELDMLSDSQAEDILAELQRMYITDKYKNRTVNECKGNTSET